MYLISEHNTVLCTLDLLKTNTKCVKKKFSKGQSVSHICIYFSENLDMAFWSEFLEACSHTENVSIICRDGILRSHKLVLANVSKCMENILKDIPTGDEATIYVTDISKNDIEGFLLNAASDKSNLHQELASLFAIDASPIVPKQEIHEDKNSLSFPDNSPIQISIKYCPEKYENEDCLGDENEAFEGDANDSKKAKPKSNVKKRYRYYDSKYLDKKERTENALAALKR